MKFEFKVIRQTTCIEEHTVEIDADSSLKAREMALNGAGKYTSFDQDEPQLSMVTEVRLMKSFTNRD